MRLNRNLTSTSNLKSNSNSTSKLQSWKWRSYLTEKRMSPMGFHNTATLSSHMKHLTITIGRNKKEELNWLFSSERTSTLRMSKQSLRTFQMVILKGVISPLRWSTRAAQKNVWILIFLHCLKQVLQPVFCPCNNGFWFHLIK